jgi:hypothetical protein
MRRYGPLYQLATARSCGIVSSREDKLHCDRLRRHIVKVVHVSSKSESPKDSQASSLSISPIPLLTLFSHFSTFSMSSMVALERISFIVCQPICITTASTQILSWRRTAYDDGAFCLVVWHFCSQLRHVVLARQQYSLWIVRHTPLRRSALAPR